VPAHHRRLGGLYFEWALSRVNEAELARLGRTLHRLLKEYAAYWRNVRSPVPADAASYEGDLRALGWLPPVRFADVALEVVVRDILDHRSM